MSSSTSDTSQDEDNNEVTSEINLLDDNIYILKKRNKNYKKIIILINENERRTFDRGELFKYKSKRIYLMKIIVRLKKKLLTLLEKKIDFEEEQLL